MRPDTELTVRCIAVAAFLVAVAVKAWSMWDRAPESWRGWVRRWRASWRGWARRLGQFVEKFISALLH